MFNFLQPRELQHASLPCPTLSPGVCSNSCPLSWWCSNHLILCLHLLLLPSIFPSIRVFSNESVLPMRWPNYWSFSFSISPSNEYSGLISFRIDWFGLLVVQGTLKRLLDTFMNHSFIRPEGLGSLNEAMSRDTQDRRVIMDSSDKTWFSGGRNGKPFQYPCHENPMNRF